MSIGRSIRGEKSSIPQETSSPINSKEFLSFTSYCTAGVRQSFVEKGGRIPD